MLNPDPKALIKIQHDPKLGTMLTGVKEQVVMNPAQVVALLQGGEAYRHVSSTEMNDKSSRAHTLFKLIVESKKVTNGSGMLCIPKMKSLDMLILHFILVYGHNLSICPPNI